MGVATPPERLGRFGESGHSAQDPGDFEFYKKGCQGKEMGIDRSQEDFLRSSPLRLGEAVLPFLFSFASLVRAGNAIELERAASQGG